MVVEDEAFVAWDLSQAIEASGMIVVGPAPSISAGFKLASDEHFCAAILDINLGSETVWPLADALKERQIPFGFVSANLRHSELEDRFADAPRLTKPVRERDLVAMVQGLVARANC